MKKRTSVVKRKTRETDISVKLNIDGNGAAKINTGIGFLDHMLELFAFWGFFDLEIIAKGDLKIDIHHTNEDIGIVLGQAFKKALGDKKGIIRIGFASVPMEDVLATVVVDINGRGFLSLDESKFKKHKFGATEEKTAAKYGIEGVKHFLESFAQHVGMNLTIKVDNPSEDAHTTLEPIFKALGIALDAATQIDPRRKGIPSTKGVID